MFKRQKGKTLNIVEVMSEAKQVALIVENFHSVRKYGIYKLKHNFQMMQKLLQINARGKINLRKSFPKLNSGKAIQVTVSNVSSTNNENKEIVKWKAASKY